MKFLVVLVALCLASPALCAYANYGGYNGGYSHGGYNGPLASPVVTPNGFLADTPEVAAAKAAHFSEVAKVSSAPGYNQGVYSNAPAPSYHGGYAPAARYTGPLASPVVTPSGFLADTPEVAAAKAAHYSEVARAQGAPGHYAGQYAAPSASHYAAPSSGYAAAYDDGSYKPELYEQESHSGSYAAPAHAGAYSAPAHAGGYHGPLATPVVTPSGFLADTPEVAAAKAAHFSEVAKSQGHGHGYHGRYRRGAYAAYSPLVYSSHYAPLAYSRYYSAPAYSYVHHVY